MDENELKSKWVIDLECYNCLKFVSLQNQKDFDYEKVHKKLTSCVKTMHYSHHLLDELCKLSETSVDELSPSERVCFKRIVLVCILSKSLLVYESSVSNKFKVNSGMLKQVYQLIAIAWFLNPKEKRNLLRSLVYWNVMLILTSIQDYDLSNETLLLYKNLLNASQFTSLQQKVEISKDVVSRPQTSFVRELLSAVLKTSSMLANNLEVPFLVKVASSDGFAL